MISLLLFLGDKGNKWHEAKLIRFYVYEKYQVMFKATAGSGHTGDLAVDDVSIGKCMEAGMTTPFHHWYIAHAALVAGLRCRDLQ